jgi:PPOX class probable F420-dependent enzyme
VPVSQEQLKEITKAPLLGILSTTNPDGSPQATPIWYDYDGEHFNVTSFTHRVKVRNIRKNPKVSLLVVDTAGYGEPLTVIGTAEMIEEGAHEATQRLGIRYQGEEQGRASAARMSTQPRLIIRIAPERVFYGVQH